MASTTALPPPTSISRREDGRHRLLAVYCKACAGRIICRLFYCKACAGRIVCWLFLLRGLCRPLHLPAVCYNGIVLPCHALSACLCLGPMPAALICICPCSLPCAPGSSRKLQGLPCRQPQHGTALAARAPVFFCYLHCFTSQRLRASSLAPCLKNGLWDGA